MIKRNLSGVVYDYPSNYGLSSCNSHDAGLSPSSGQLDPGANPGWCLSRWCYVDKDACTTVAEQSDYFKGSDLHYSYQACGQEDLYSIEVLDRREFSSTSLAQLQDGAWVWEGNGTAMSSGAIFNTGETTLPYILDLAILQRMSDARFPSPELCGATFVNGTCWLDNSWQMVAVAALTAVADFNGRFGMHAPALSELAGCDKKLGLRLMDSASTGTTSVLALAKVLSESEAPDVIIGPSRSVASVQTAPISGIADIPQIIQRIRNLWIRLAEARQLLGLPKQFETKVYTVDVQ